ncbi:hypothetical protein ABZP36_003782 [Zizania latifolia]
MYKLLCAWLKALLCLMGSSPRYGYVPHLSVTPEPCIIGLAHTPDVSEAHNLRCAGLGPFPSSSPRAWTTVEDFDPAEPPSSVVMAVPAPASGDLRGGAVHYVFPADEDERKDKD